MQYPPTKDWLIQEYSTKRRTATDMASDFGVNKNTISYYLKKYGIVTRLNADYMRKEIDPSWLREQYDVKKRSINHIAREVKLNYRNVLARMIKFGIDRRTSKESRNRTIDGVWLREQYEVKRRTLEDITTELKIRNQTVKAKLKELGIAIRSVNDYGGRISYTLIPLLEKAGIKHTTSHVLPKLPEQKPCAHPYEIDEYLPEIGVFLELHGEYYHNVPRRMEMDKRKSELLTKHYPNIKQVVIWHKDFRTGKAEQTINQLTT